MLDPRLDFLEQIGNVANLVGLEIGALASPVLGAKANKTNTNLFYLDHLSTRGLKDKYQNDPSVNIDEIVEVDFVCPDGDIIKSVKGKKFDYVIASHVIEHAPNFLKFLSNIFDVLKPGGFAFFVIPDKRFTFDLNRPLTSFGNVLENYLSYAVKPSVGAVYDHFSTAIKLDAGKVWTGTVDLSNSSRLTSSMYAWEMANNVKKNGDYIDVHVNIFTPYSFFEILKGAIEHDIVTFEVKNFQDTLPGQLEFMVALKKPINANLSLAKPKCLDAIPELQLENLLSPYMPQVKSLSRAIEQLTRVTAKQQDELEKLKSAVYQEKSEQERLQLILAIAQQTLDRRSVKLTLFLVHKIASLFRKQGNSQAK
jgi:SAM-dependent methyltransferase